ncbi:WS/DGAT domain-containing protein [Streptomyces sp. RY43-2]|uniref:diacylglycerol O-acyltransferase n=1 Tax=Streptomyces macrolidinus TaxID=2952607 RepID=A0ABT0ZJF1_9ACTN|nr:wax ester/triacylglycerol synthase domain-containing protein [Streptomyces macrolidinus]MCN9243671.1 WS/DGAT domain-containing protein [Streptomyces macrolidinus]
MSLHPPASPRAEKPGSDDPTRIAAMPPLDAWLHRQQSGGAACMTALYVSWFEGPAPTLEALRARARQRLQPFRRLRTLPHSLTDDRTGIDNWPHWRESDELDVEHHITAPGDMSPAPLKLDRLLAKPLDHGRPPWQLHLLPAENGFALLLRAHHALLDGQSLRTVLYALLDTGPLPEPARAARQERVSVAPSAPSLGRRVAWALDDLLPKGRPLPFHGPVGPRRDIAFSRLPREVLTAARDGLKTGTRASNTAVFLASVAGALQDLGLTGRFPGLPGVCALVPVDVRTAAQAALLGNHYATVRLPLPTHRDPYRRLTAMEQRIRGARLHQRANAQADVVSSRPQRFTAFGTAAGRYVDSPRYFSLLCSSVPSPPGGFTLGTARLTAAAALPPLGPGHPLAVTMTHHHTGAVLSAVTDPDRRLAEPLAAAVDEQLRYLAG